MNELPEALYTAEQVRELDRRAIEDHGIDGYELMQRAGRAAFETLAESWPGARRVLVLAGKGNNGGDGYVIARLAQEAGLEATVVRVGDHSGLRGAASRAAGDCSAAGVRVEDFAGRLPDADVCVDALLGTGIDRPLRGDVLSAVELLASSAPPVMAVDVPTGLHADTGAVLGDCAPAAVTVTFIGLKLGLFTGAAPGRTGPVRFHGLDVPGTVYEGIEPAAKRITRRDMERWLPPRARDAHKGAFGHVLVIGGDRGMPGAVRMAGEAAARAGAGLVSVATIPDHVAPVAAGSPEVMVHGVAAPADLSELVERATVVALGPGLGQGAWGKRMWLAAMRVPRPLVLDADGLNWLSRLPREREDWVLTPHPGEAARLLRSDTGSIQSDRPSAARELARRHRAVVVLKGSGTLVCSPEGRLSLCDRGNPGMASGGMGDVLTGVIAGLIAQGLEPYDAACAGVHAHAEVADRAAIAGERGLVATDLLEGLRAVLNPR